MPEFLVICHGHLEQSTIDELHARGIYLSQGGQPEHETIEELHRHHLIVDVEEEEDAVTTAEEAVESAGGEGTFELEGPAVGA